MIKSVKEIIEKSLQDYTKKEREKWVVSWQGQAVLAVNMIFWSQQAEEAMKKSGVAGLVQYYDKLNKQLNAVVSIVRTNISKLERCTLEALIVLDVHGKDVIKHDLIDKNVSDPSEFSWLSQLRYYWEDNNVLVRIINASLDYNYEYLGNSARLVITPLTDRCYRTLCGAIFLNYGGAPEGPAGTGKTETVKDLSKALARQCIVFNCSDGLDYLQMAKFFKGLASCGAWSCFDEFNRIELEVLSVIAQQLQTIQIAVDKRQLTFEFEGSVIPLKLTCNCFITMNPGYAGRSDLPDNLKALFRSVAMMVPDYAMIAEISLYSFGFTDAKNLSQKIVTTYKLCSEQLSSQDHYDYGMRAVKSVLTAAGNLKRKYVDQDESIVMLRAINDVNLAKFLSHDLPLFKNITSDLFPSVVLPEPDYKDLIISLKNQIKISNLQDEEYFILKIIQLYEMIIVRHGLMVVGLPFAGKTSAIKVLAAALTELNEKKLMGEMKTHINIINPKSITMGQLYGNFDEVSHDWSDGVLAVWFRIQAAQMDKKDRRWLLFDGPVDAIWIENMNTVLDDNKKLCLMSGEIIQMSDNMNLIYEPMDLAVASPATVSRCGMVYMEPHQMGWRPIFNSWKNKLPVVFTEDHIKTINELADVIIQPCLDYLRNDCQETSPTQDQNLIQSCLKIWRSLMIVFDNESYFTQQEKKVVHQIIESCFVFAAIWSLCITVNTEFRKPFDMQFKKICNGEIDNIKKLQKKILPSQFDRGTIYDYVYFADKNKWENWMDLVNKDTIDQFPKGSQVQDIIVTTVDTIRYSHIQEMFIANEMQSLFVGPTGTGKSAYIQNVLLNKLNKEKFLTINIGFSAQTHCNQVQDILDSKLDTKRGRKGNFGPKVGQRAVIFVDDLNMPKKEFYGAQPPVEILRQFLDQGGWYDRKDNKHPFKYMVDSMIIAAMGPPGGGKTFITPRILRHFNVIAFANFDENSLNSIFRSILKWYFKTFNFTQEVQIMEQKIVAGTLNIYKRIQDDLKPTPLKSHYTFNLRDFSKVICGMCMAGKNQVPNGDVCVRLWAHETIRVFGDRLINDEDRMWMLGAIKETTRTAFGFNFDNVFMHLDTDKNGKIETLDEIRGLIFGDVLTPFGMTERPYEEIKEKDKLQSMCEEALVQYNNMSDKPMDLVLFSFAIEHLLRVSRILKQPGGNALLVGVGGSGRQSITRLASKMADFDVYQVEIKKNYRMQEWREDVRSMLRSCGGKGNVTVFLFTDVQIKEEGFLEDVNNILNTGEIPNLFADEMPDIIELARPFAKQENKAPDGTISQLYSFFVERCKKRLHIVLCFSPIGEAFRGRVRNFPSLVNCTTIDWFSEWPKDALDSVAKRFLQEVEMDYTVRQSCIQMVQVFHESTSRAAQQFYRELKRHYYVTPTSYLELITTFKTILREKREQILALQHRYQHGYDCLITTESNVSKMQRELEELQPILIETSKETEKKAKIVEKETNEAEKIRELVAVDEAIASQAAGEANAIKLDCEKELGEALPILQAAEKALECVTGNDVSYLKKLPQPPADAKMVLSAVCVLMNVAPEGKMDINTQKKVYDYWPSAVRMMNQNDFLKKLKDYDKENIPESIVKKLQEYVKDPKFTIDHLRTISEIAANLASWVIAMDKFYGVNLIVKPKKIALAEAQAKYDLVNGKLKIKQEELRVVQEKVDNLRADLKFTQDRKAELEHDVAECEAKLERATKLIGGLGGEKARWNEEAITLGGVYKNLTGDVLISSGMIAYLGAFTSVFRDMLSKDWVKQCFDKEIPNSGTFSLQRVLGDAVKIRTWTTQGLPSDQFSVENAIITSKARRWPLFIDPQGQANKWIRNMEKEREIKIMKLTDGNYLKILENCIRVGIPVLIENVNEELDPAIEPLLQKQIFKKGSSWNMRLGDSTIEYSKDFKFYLTTKLRNPHYLPEVSTKVTLLNFMITYEGLADQLLGIVVAKENIELETKKEQLVLEGARNKNKLEEIEDQILKTLSGTTDILGDSKAIEILSNAKTLSNDIAKKQEIAEKTEKEIDELRMGYRPVAERTAGLFFCISDLANIDPMYQYSLAFFINLFTSAIMNSEKSDDLEERLKFLNTEFLISLYRNICRSLFEKDKMIFSFLLTIKLKEMVKEIDLEEYRFLLTGGISLGGEQPELPVSWLSEKSWGEILRMCDLKHFKGFLNHFREHIDYYQKLYDSPTPQTFKIMPEWDHRLNSFQKMIFLRCLRPDKVVPAMFNYIVEQLGESFTNPPPFDLSSIYKDSSSITPLIFVLSPGADPLNSLLKFTETKKKSIERVSLGQGQGPKAEKYIQEALKTGQWVVLQNCHLAVSWMGKLEKICEEFSPDPKITHREFRLWLTSYPSKDFPVSILQNGIKMTNEPPKGLKSNLLQSYLTDPISSKTFFESCVKPREFRKLLFGLCFFHAVIQERRKFGPLGWNIPYEFNESDLRISVRQLSIFINEYPDKTPFDALKYLTGECNYGGRVTDDKDRRLLMIILEDFYNEKLFDDNHKLSPSGKYFAPQFTEYEGYIDYIKALPQYSEPEIFGFHANADITKDKNETNATFDAILSTMQNSTSGSAGNMDQIMTKLADSILKDVPEPYDIKSAEKKYPVSYEQSMNTVLTQELIRFNGLINVIRSSLKDIKRAIKGEILLSQQLEAALNALFDGRVPQMWKSKSYPSLKPLGGYINDLKSRLEFFQHWLNHGIPSFYWINKFFFTQGFLTGAMQNYARKTQIAIDKLVFDFEIIQDDNAEEPEDGINVCGTYIEGCKWNYQTRLLDESDPKILFVKCPMIWFKPCLKDEMKNPPHYNCPIYKTSERRGILSTTGHSTNFVLMLRLPSDKPQSHWVKRGVAMLCSLDD